VLELKTSDGDDGRSFPTLSPLGWDHWILGRKILIYKRLSLSYLVLFHPSKLSKFKKEK